MAGVTSFSIIFHDVGLEDSSRHILTAQQSNQIHLLKNLHIYTNIIPDLTSVGQ